MAGTLGRLLESDQLKIKIKLKAVPGIEPGFPESESDVITTTPYRLYIFVGS
jgi:hypothetical protein